MFDETGLFPDVCRDKSPLRQLVDKSESYLQSRGVKDDDYKKKDEKNKTKEKLTRMIKIRIHIYKTMV